MNDASVQHSSALRNQLHHYIEQADERVLEAMSILIGQTPPSATSHSYDDATLKMLHDRRDAHLAGQSRSYTAEESLSLLRNPQRKMMR